MQQVGVAQDLVGRRLTFCAACCDARFGLATQKFGQNAQNEQRQHTGQRDQPQIDVEEEDHGHEDDRPGRIQKGGEEAAAHEAAQVLKVAQRLYAHLLAQRHVLDQRGHHRGAKGGLQPGAKAAGQPLPQRVEGQEEQKARPAPMVSAISVATLPEAITCENNCSM